MTMGEAGNKINAAISGYVGNAAILGLGTVLVGLSGWVLLTTSQHSTDLKVLSEDIKSLVVSVEHRNAAIDTQIGHIVNVEDTIRDEVSRLQEAEALRELREEKSGGAQ